MNHPPVHAEEVVSHVTRHVAGAVEVMRAMGVNHCCGANLTLREAAAAAGVSLDVLLEALNAPRRTRV
jgi:iron-sulfur cluster repair protein YtfE (RIC family)